MAEYIDGNQVKVRRVAKEDEVYQKAGEVPINTSELMALDGVDNVSHNVENYATVILQSRSKMKPPISVVWYAFLPQVVSFKHDTMSSPYFKDSYSGYLDHRKAWAESDEELNTTKMLIQKRLHECSKIAKGITEKAPPEALIELTIAYMREKRPGGKITATLILDANRDLDKIRRWWISSTRGIFYDKLVGTVEEAVAADSAMHGILRRFKERENLRSVRTRSMTLAFRSFGALHGHNTPNRVVHQLGWLAHKT